MQRTKFLINTYILYTCTYISPVVYVSRATNAAHDSFEVTLPAVISNFVYVSTIGDIVVTSVFSTHLLISSASKTSRMSDRRRLL